MNVPDVKLIEAVGGVCRVVQELCRWVFHSLHLASAAEVYVEGYLPKNFALGILAIVDMKMRFFYVCSFLYLCLLQFCPMLVFFFRVCIFAIIFWLLNEEMLSPIILLVVSGVLSAAAYAYYRSFLGCERGGQGFPFLATIFLIFYSSWPNVHE